MRIDQEGRTVWQKDVNGPSHIGSWESALMPGGNFVIGVVGEWPGGRGIAQLIQFNQSGEIVSKAEFGPYKGIGFQTIIPLGNVEAIIAGTTIISDRARGWASRVKLTGEVIWESRFTKESVREISDGTRLPGGMIGLTGSADPKNSSGEYADLFVTRLNPADGRLGKVCRYGGKSLDVGRSLISLPDGTVIVTGSNWSKGHGSGDAWTLRMKTSCK